MRVLLVHNYYGSSAPSGENQVFEAERAMLERYGKTVDVFTRHSDEIRIGLGRRSRSTVVGRFFLWMRRLRGLVKGAVCTVANPFAARALGRKIREFRPDVVHFHNTFPLISPLAVRAARKSGAKVVMTLHNYRMVCAAGIPMRCGRVCRDCFSYAVNPSIRQSVNLSILPALRNRCYRGSMWATLPLALNIWLYRKCWAKWVDNFVVLSEFQKKVMIECGLPAEKIVVKGNFIQSNKLNNPNDRTMRSGVVFVGRLSDEKGVKTLLKAWRMLNQSIGQSVNPSIPQSVNPSLPLTLIGDGVQRVEYESLATGLNVRFLGKLSHARVLEELAKAKLLVAPSECWETFGLVLVEAAMCGTPAVVSDLGALPGIVAKLGVGKVFKSGDADGLAVKIRDVMDGQLSLQEFKVDEFGEERNFKKLNEIYSA